MPIPEEVGGREAHADAAEREALLKAHERAAEYFQAQLSAPAGRKAQRMLHDRGITADTIERLGIGYAPPAYEGMKAALVKEGLPLPLAGTKRARRRERQRPDRRSIPRTADDSDCARRRLDRRVRRPRDGEGSAAEVPELARNVDLHQGPDPLRTESHQGDIRRLGYAVLVEGYFDFAQLVQAGITPVVASCGTALTPAQAQLLRRFTSKVILSFDPDAAGQGAAARSCELLVAEGFEVNVAVLPAGEDPDSFVQKRGRDAYLDLLKTRSRISNTCSTAPRRRTTSLTTKGGGSF